MPNPERLAGQHGRAQATGDQNGADLPPCLRHERSLLALVRPSLAQQPGPIRIGCITALSGPQEVLGRPILDGAQIAVNQVNDRGGVHGRPLLLLEADDRAEPDRAVEAARAFAKDGVNLLWGAVTSPVALAISPRLQQLDTVMISCSAASERLTHEGFSTHYFRITDQTYMRNRAQARLMAERYPNVTRWGAIIPDNEYGRSAYAAFRDGLLEYYPGMAKQQATIAEPTIAAFGATDFAPQIATIKAAAPEGLFIAVYGTDAIDLYEQSRHAGLFRSVKVLADSFNEFLVPMALGSTLPENLWLGMTWYYGAYQTIPMGRELYQDYIHRTGNPLPMGFINAGHSAVHAYAAAIAKAGSPDTKAVIAALEGLTFDTAKGPVTIRPEDHQAICDVNFIRVKASDDHPMGMVDYLRADIEVVEFIRYGGADVIEPPEPGKPIHYRT